ncbi:MAG: GTPase [Chloroflexota bacterium]
MPTNLPPDYFEADKRFRQAESPAEKAAALEELISTVPKHKGTDKLRADLRRQLSRLKADAQQARKKTGGHASTFQIDKEGAGQAVLVGATNVGKSALVRALTNAEPEVSAAPFTTWKPTPGMLLVENVQVQLVDTPPLDPAGFVDPGLFDLLRRCDLILLMVDLQDDPLQQLEDALNLLYEHRLAPVQRREQFADLPRFVFKPLLVLANKCDDQRLYEDFEVLCELLVSETPGDVPCPMLPISVLTGRNFDEFKRRVFEALDVVRVYARPPGQEPDLARPFVLKRGCTVIDLAAKVHRDFYNNLKSARVWGSAAFDGQMVQRDYVLQDGDIIELRA